MIKEGIKKRNFVFLLGIIFVTGFFLRAYHLNQHDFWSDEAVSLLFAKYASFQNTVDYGRFSTDPVLFPFLLNFWMSLTKNEALFRVLPLIFGFMSVVLIYFVGKELCNKKAGLIASFLLSISPFHIYYSQELRNYAPLVFLSLASVYFFERIFKKNNLPPWIWFVVSTVLCLYTHNVALFLLLAENLYFLVFRKQEKLLLKWCLSQFIILFFYLPWMLVLINQIFNMRMIATFFWAPKPSLPVVTHTFNIFNLGYNASGRAYFLGGIAFLPIFFWGVWKGLKEKAGVSLLLCWMLVPMGMLILASLWLKQGSIYIYKTLIFSTPPYYILVANGLGNLKNNKFALGILFLIVILSAGALKNYYGDVLPLPLNPYRPGIFIKKEFKPAANYVSREFKEGDIVAHTSRSTIAPFMYYNNNALKEKWVASREDDCLHWEAVFSKYPFLSESGFFGSFLAEEIKKISQGHKRIWLVYSGWELEKRELSYVKRWLDKNFKLLRKNDFKGIDVYLYEGVARKDI